MGIRFAAAEAATAQLIYLVLFSYAFFFEGFTGLSIAIGALLTLFVVMQVTGRIRWSDYFASCSTPQLSRWKKMSHASVLPAAWLFDFPIALKSRPDCREFEQQTKRRKPREAPTAFANPSL